MANVQVATRVTDISNMLHTMQDSITALQADMGRRFVTLRDHVDRQFAALTAANNQSSSQLNTIQQNLTVATNDLGQLTAVCTQSDRRLTTMEQDLRTANTRLTTANNELSQLTAASNESNLQLVAMQQDLAAANTKLTAANDNLGQLTTTSNESNQQLVTMRQDLTDVNTGLAAVNTNLGQLTTANNQSNRQLTTILQNLNTANDQQGLTTIRGQADTIFTEMRELRTELRAGHFNSAARIINANVGRCNMAISAFHGVDNEHIPNFPTTYAHLEHLNSRSTLDPK